MLYLIIQTWLFLLIAWLIGLVVGYGLSKDKKAQRHTQIEEELREERSRTIALGKDVEEFRSRVTELEGLPAGVRASKVAAREEMTARLAQLERELDVARGNEKKFHDESERLRSDVDGFRQRYLEARAKWDEYQAKAEALASAPALNLTEAHVAPSDAMRRRVVELESLLAEAGKSRERALEQAKQLSTRVSELERQMTALGSGNDQTKAMQARLGELETQLAAAAKGRDQAHDHAKTMMARASELEAQLAAAGKGHEKTGEQARALQSRISELELQLAATSKGSEKSSEQGRILQARIAELEGRFATSIATARETDALRTRVADLQDKLGEAEVALRRAITSTKQDSASEALLAQSSADSQQLKTRLAEVERQLADAQRQVVEARSLRALESKGAAGAGSERIADLEKQLERAKRQASEAQSLQAQVTSLEARLAMAQKAVDDRSGKGEDVGLLKARLSDVEARLMSSSQASVEFESLRSRVMTLEALLHEAAKSRDEAAILRSKVAELDGRLGQAMKAVADTRRESEKV